MALGTFAVGEYTMTYNGVSVGLVESGGQNLRYRPSVKPINNTATYGDTEIDGIYRGKGSVRLMVTFKEWIASVKQAIWPFSNFASPAFDGTLGTIGKLASDAAKAIVLTAVTGTPAATAGPATLTANLALLAADNDVSIFFGPDERNIPVVLTLYPYDDAGTKRFFKLT